MKKVVCVIIYLLFYHGMYAQDNTAPYILVLGVAQDGGYPHMGCSGKCCKMAWEDRSMRRNVVSLALVDPKSGKWWLFEATPDIKEQLHYFEALTKGLYNFLPSGIFITHAHIGHYTGLMELGKEVMGTRDVPVYAMPRMKNFLETNGPWSQLVTLHNILLRPLHADSTVQLSENVSVRSFVVPHRDEYSETAGLEIITSNKKYLFIPDINKWEKWDRSILDEVNKVDIAMVDATFYDANELPGRNMANVPHPTVGETMGLFEHADKQTKAKIYFIHFNHTNPILWDANKREEVKSAGFNIAVQGGEL